MNSLHIAICEDNFDELSNLLSILNTYHINITYDTFSTGKNFANSFKRDKYDLLIMDIYLGDLNGVELISDIRKIDSEICVAFYTSSQEHTRASYRLNAIKYLEKPTSKSEVFQLLDFALMKKNNAPRLELVSNRKNITVLLSNIVYLEQKARKTLIHLISGEIITSNIKIRELLPSLGANFLNCHKSYVVNLSYVKSINAELLVFEMVTGSNAYIRREDFIHCRQVFENYLFERTRR